MAVSTQYLRQRTFALTDFWIKINKRLSDKESRLLNKQLAWGFVPEKYRKEFDEFAKTLEVSPLGGSTFVEKTSHSTWFVMHPEKVAGKEVGTTSYIFPVTLKGTKADVIKMIDKTLKGAKPKQDKKLKLLRLRARAARARIQLIKLKQ